MYHGGKSAIRESFPEEGTPGCGVKNTQDSARWSQGGGSDEALEEDAVWYPVGEAVAGVSGARRPRGARGEDAGVEACGPRRPCGRILLCPKRMRGTTEMLEAAECRVRVHLGRETLTPRRRSRVGTRVHEEGAFRGQRSEEKVGAVGKEVEYGSEVSSARLRRC